MLFKASHFFTRYSLALSLTISSLFIFFSCNLTCESGQFGVNCAQTCPCHDKNCNPVSGACNLCKNKLSSLSLSLSLCISLLICEKTMDTVCYGTVCYDVCFGDTGSILGGLRHICGVSHHLFFFQCGKGNEGRGAVANAGGRVGQLQALKKLRCLKLCNDLMIIKKKKGRRAKPKCENKKQSVSMEHVNELATCFRKKGRKKAAMTAVTFINYPVALCQLS